MAAFSRQTDNAGMLRSVPAAALLGLAACSPTLNWREVRADPTALKAMLPCKPDKGARKVPMGGREVELKVIGCDTGGATFAILYGDVVDPLRSGQVLAQWETATLANMRSAKARDEPFLPRGAMALPQSVRVSAAGQRADGSAVESQAAYFARGSQVFQAVIYADRIAPEASEPFFSGLAFE
jgi:hypothetical protein